MQYLVPNRNSKGTSSDPCGMPPYLSHRIRDQYNMANVVILSGNLSVIEIQYVAYQRYHIKSFREINIILLHVIKSKVNSINIRMYATPCPHVSGLVYTHTIHIEQ